MHTPDIPNVSLVSAIAQISFRN